MELREKVIEMLCDLVDSDGFTRHSPTEVADKILAIHQIKNAQKLVTTNEMLWRAESEMFKGYRADMGRLINGKRNA